MTAAPQESVTFPPLYLRVPGDSESVKSETYSHHYGFADALDKQLTEPPGMPTAPTGATIMQRFTDPCNPYSTLRYPLCCACCCPGVCCAIYPFVKCLDCSGIYKRADRKAPRRAAASAIQTRVANATMKRGDAAPKKATNEQSSWDCSLLVTTLQLDLLGECCAGICVC